MTDKCRRCKRPRAADLAQWDSNEDGALCGSHLPEYGATKRELYGDCQQHLAHILGMKLVRAVSLLSSASMSHVMSADYQRRHADEINAFLADDALQELIK